MGERWLGRKRANGPGQLGPAAYSESYVTYAIQVVGFSMGSAASMRATRGDLRAAEVRHDLSRGYAQLSVHSDGAGRAVLWVEAPALDLELTLSPAQVALLASSAVGFALAPVADANTEQCWQPRVADRSPARLDAAYEAVVAAVQAFRQAATGAAAN
jgi:hypothetical protein